MKLLYIEDDPSFAQMLHAELLTYRTILWDLVHAVSLDEACERLDEEEFDAIVADLSLPDSDGLDTCRHLCQAAPNVPLVLLSRTNDMAIAIQAAKMGAQDYLFKGSLGGAQVMRRVRFAIERDKVRGRQQQVAAVGATSPAAVIARDGTFGGAAGTGEFTGWEVTSEEAPASSPQWIDPDQGIRILHVEDDATFARWIASQLESDSSVPYEVEHFECLQPALERLSEVPFSAVLLDFSLPDSDGMASLHATLPHVAEAPVLVLTAHDDESTAVQSIQRGAEDYLVKTELGKSLLDRSIRLALARRGKSLAAARPSSGRKKQVHVPSPVQTFAPSATAELDDDRRRHRRYLLSKPMSVIPIRANNMPDTARSGEAIPLDLSVGGVGFQIGEPNRLPSRRWVVGIEAEDGQLYFATVEVRHTHPVNGGVRIGAKFVAGERDVLSKTNLMPQLDPETSRLSTALPVAALEKWAELGIIRPVLLDRVFVCPECRGLPTFGNGCRACGSVQLASCQLIHHFACAHVGYVSDFEAENEIVCPKCRTRGLVVGADFEFLNGPYRCLRCGFSDTELEQVGSCLRCELRFPVHQAAEEELIGYHVNRLDPLALLD